MTRAGEPDGPVERQPPGTSRPSRALLLNAAPVAAVLLAGIAIAAAYLISHTSTPHATKSPGSAKSLPPAPPAPVYPTPTLLGALSPEHGPDGMSWQWVGEAASLQLTGVKRGWLAFRALSPGLPRKLAFTGPHRERTSVRVGAAPGVYLAGPLSEGAVALSASPVAAAKRGRPPTLAVFLSTLRVMPNPVAVLPGTGFWNTESAGGVVFNWLRNTGALDVYAPASPAGPVTLSFIARSLGGQRSLTARSGQTIRRATVTSSPQQLTLGPFPLVRGRARVLLSAAPGPRRYGSDPRSLSVQVAALGGYTTAAGT